MPKACELKRGSVVSIDGTPHVVDQLTVQTPSARGASTLYKVRFRDVKTKRKSEQTYKGDDFIKDADLSRQEAQFLFSQPGEYTFMNLTDYSQFVLTAEDLGDDALYLMDEMTGIKALISDESVIGIELPASVKMPVIECDPPLKGASATARTKPATFSTGLVVQVPEYIERDEVLEIDTRTGKYLCRAKE
jgi:elongation factor P